MTAKIDKTDSKWGVITWITLTNDNGASAVLSSLGAGIVKVTVPDRNGKLENVVIGYADPADYMADGPCAGKTPGRYANRIAKGKFTLDGKTYELAINNADNALHGGPTGFMNRIWDVKSVEDGKVVFSYLSKDGEEGYPGNLQVEVAYTWNDANELRIDYKASTDAETVVNLTNHAYFNLGGDNSGSVLDQELKLACSRWLPTTETQIPTGIAEPVEGTPMDFTSFKKLGQDIRTDFEALRIGKGYDHCFVADNWIPGKLAPVAWLKDSKSGRTLTVETTQPGVQVYTANWFGGETPLNFDGRRYDDNDGVALECQHFPDSPNHSNFPSTTLKPGENFEETIVYKFGLDK